MRIRSWHFAVRNHRELIPRSILAMQEPGMVESLSKNVTRQGLTSTTLNYLRVSSQFDYIDASRTRNYIQSYKIKISNLFQSFLLLQLCVILEPMQELMSRHKAYALSPRDCLKTTLFQKWQKMVAPPGKLSFFFLQDRILKRSFKSPIVSLELMHLKYYDFIIIFYNTRHKKKHP